MPRKTFIDLLIENAEKRREYFANFVKYAERVKEAVKRLDPDARVIIFGSVVRGDVRPDSDIDLLIITRIAENLDKRILFDYLIKKLATMGAFIEKRDDNRLIARMTVASIKGKKPLSFVIKIHDKNIELEFPSTKENMQDLLSLKSTIKELVTEYSKKTLTTARVRTILSLVTECQKKLLTAKDSILVDMSLKDVLDIIHEVIEILKGDIIFKSVSDQIMKELKDLSSELRKNEPIPEKMKHVFEDKIDSWFSLVKEQAERFLEHSL